jgi:hypothetical protein
MSKMDFYILDLLRLQLRHLGKMQLFTTGIYRIDTKKQFHACTVKMLVLICTLFDDIAPVLFC